jgi:carboxypeptidase family protein
MRRLTALLLTAALPLTTTPLFAAANPAQGQGGTINGTAQNAQGQNLASYTVRVRNLTTAQISASTTSGAAGQFSFVGLDPASYVVEIVDQAGNIIGTSAAITVAAGATVTITVGATAAAAAAAAAAGGTSFLASTAGIITVAAAAAGVAGAVAIAKNGNASPSR